MVLCTIHGLPRSGYKPLLLRVPEDASFTFQSRILLPCVSMPLFLLGDIVEKDRMYMSTSARPDSLGRDTFAHRFRRPFASPRFTQRHTAAETLRGSYVAKLPLGKYVIKVSLVTVSLPALQRRINIA